MNGPVFLLLVGVGGALIPVFELTQRKQSMKDCGRSTRGVAGGTPLACSASSLSEAVVRQRSRSRPDAPVGMSSPGHLHRVVGVRELMRQRRSPTILATATTRPAVTPRWGTYSRVSLPPATTSNAVYNLANRLTPWNGAVVSRQQLEPDLRRARSPTRTTPQPAHPGSSRETGAGGVPVRRAGTSDLPQDRNLHDQARPTRGGTCCRSGPTTTASRPITLTGLDLDQPFLRTAGSSTSYYLSDALGSIVGLASSTGTVPTS